MNKTLKISFLLKNTYRVNSIAYAIKQMPILKRILPGSIYQMRWLKVLANVLAIIWEVASVFLGKFFYVALVLVGAAGLYPIEEDGRLVLHILVLLSIIGAYSNTYMFNPTNDKYYALILMRMNAGEYTLVNYFYAILKLLVGFTAANLLFGSGIGIPLWLLVLIPFFVAGLKISMSAYYLWRYEKTGTPANENLLNKGQWILMGVLLAAAYGLPLAGIMLPEKVCIAVIAAGAIGGVFSLGKILRFSRYREVYQQILTQSRRQMDAVKGVERAQNNKLISADVNIVSERKGFEYLNELFIKRHQKILWKSARKIAGISFAVILCMLVSFFISPEWREETNQAILSFLPCFAFIMYAINRGAGFTRALFMNCDHSLLTYSCYKKPEFILELFQIRLREIIKINLLPAFIIGLGMALLLFASGGTRNPLHYVILVVSILCLSIFFSVHYLTIYYLLQPYNVGSEMKSGTYQLIMTLTYMVCYFLIHVELPLFVFGLLSIVFCVLYCVIASILVYKCAPKTFKLRT